MLAGVSLLSAWVPREIGRVVDALVGANLPLAALASAVGALVVIGVLTYGFRFGWRVLLFGAAQRLGVDLRMRLYRSLTGHGPAFFHARRTGDLMALATNDIDAVEMAAGEAFLAGFDGTLTLVIVIAMMSLGIDWRLAAIALLPFPLMALGFWWISRRVHEASRDSLDAFSRLNEYTQETLAGVRTVRALGLERQVHAEYSRRTAQAATSGFDALRWESAYEPVVGFTLTAATALALGFGGAMVADGELSIGELTAFAMYLGQLIWPMFAMGWVLSLIERARAAWARLAPVLALPPGIDDSGTLATVPHGALALERVSFVYPGQGDEGQVRGGQAREAQAREAQAREGPLREGGRREGRRRARQVLDEVTVSIRPGEMLAIVGPTGSGKSTLVALLLRQYAASDGVIRLADQPLADYRLAALRAAIAWVPQEAFLFSASIGANIALSRPTATREAIEAVARLADLHEDIARLPEGYETLVGERGVTLSGGQRQRLAIARALLADAPLLILDDALSAVDTATEGRILAHLRASVRTARRSLIVTGHRLSGVADADLIIVLDAGRIVERGTHEALLARNGWYAAQWRYQRIEASFDGQ